MTPTRSLQVTLAAIVLTLLAVVAHPLIPERRLSLAPDPDLTVIFAPYGDAEQGGPSHSEWVGPPEERLWSCRIEPQGEFVFCGLNLILSSGEGNGVDLTDYHAIDLELVPSTHGKRVQFFMRHFDERYSDPNDANSAQFNKFDFLPGELDGSVHLHFDELTLADWWSANRGLPRELRRPAFHNVVAVGFGFAEKMEPGLYTVQIKRAAFVGEWISAEAWYLGILLLWLFWLAAWVVYRMRELAVRERHQRLSLARLSTRNALLKEESEHYRQLSTRDPLTGAYNRFGYEQRLSEIIYQEAFQPICLILMDVDHFKAFNDSQGHDAGDRVLQQLTRVVNEHTRKHDVFCRWGGEEFLLLCPATNALNAEAIAEKIRALMQNIELEAVPDVHITASFGVCEIQPGEPYVDAFVRADGALYRAKELGRNRVVLCQGCETEALLD